MSTNIKNEYQYKSGKIIKQIDKDYNKNIVQTILFTYGDDGRIVSEKVSTDDYHSVSRYIYDDKTERVFLLTNYKRIKIRKLANGGYLEIMSLPKDVSKRYMYFEHEIIYNKDWQIVEKKQRILFPKSDSYSAYIEYYDNNGHIT